MYYNPQNPYNAFCPETDGLLCVTGCMATALSQVLYYYRWPQGQLAGELPAYPMVNGRVLEALPPTTFDWDNMVDDYRQTTTDVQQAAVAKLMRYCGQLVQMDYTPQLSSGYFYDVDMLVRLFGYDQSVYWAQADGYTVSGWDGLLYNELRESRPLVYLGMSTGGGHAFVVDGYEVQDGSGYFHVNWGWGGDCNGFYKISLLNPDMSGTGGSTTKDGYNYMQAALIGLMPAQQPAESYGRYLTSVMWNGTKDEQPHVFGVSNTSYMPGVFEVALAERHADGTTDIHNLFGRQTQEIVGYSYAGLNTDEHTGIEYLTLPENLTEGLTPGHHELVFVNKEADTDAPWRPIYGPNCYIELNIGDDGLATDTVFHPLPLLTGSSRTLKIEGVKQCGLYQRITATIKNNSDDDYIGGLECMAYYLENNKLKIVAWARTGIMIEGTGTADATFGLTLPRAGNYVIVITRGGEDISDTKLADIKKAKGYIVHKTISIDELAFYCTGLQYSERPDGKGNPAYYLDIAVTNGTPMDYNAALLANLYIPNSQGGYDPLVFPGVQHLVTLLSLMSNNSFITNIRLPEALEPGEYAIEMLISNDFQSLMLNDYFVFAAGPFTVTNTTGISTADNEESNTADGNTSWFTIDGRKLDSRPTTKGIYINKGKKQIIK
ncbi:MAG: C10 family peptidase [Prevotella sp.]|nr:C10 family peptidase [Prevotella sp.]